SRPGPAPDLVADLERGVRGLRVGTSGDFLVPSPDPGVRSAYEATLRRLEELGAHPVEVAMPHHELVVRTVMAVLSIEGGVHLDALAGDRPRVFGPIVERMNEQAPKFEVGDLVRAQERRQWIARDYHAAFLEADVLVLPVAPIPA